MSTSFSGKNRYLALEWDAREARLVVARRRGRQAVIEQAFTVDLRPRDASQAAAEVNLGQRISAALEARRVGKAETLVAIGRASIELRKVPIPPAPPEEQPGLVRFAAMRQFSGLGDDWPLDFVPLDELGDPGNVLAAVISPDLVKQIEQTCNGAGVTARQLVLRPFAAAALWRRRRQKADGACELMVDLLADEADLSVLIGGQVAFLRTIRLGGEGSLREETGALVGEIRRTMGASQNQLAGRKVEAIVVCGATAEHKTLADELGRTLQLPVTQFEPFAGLELDPSLSESLPVDSGRFAPLLGMVCDEAAGVAPAMDFLHPRRPPAPPDRRKLWIAVAAGVAAVLLIAFLLIQWRWASLDARIAALAAQSKSLDKDVQKANAQIKQARQVDDWLAADISWLDELRSVSEKAPSAESLRLVQISGSSSGAAGGPGSKSTAKLILDCRATHSNVQSQLLEALRDARHRPEPSPLSEAGEKDGKFKVKFTQPVSIRPVDEASPAATGAAP